MASPRKSNRQDQPEQPGLSPVVIQPGQPEEIDPAGDNSAAELGFFDYLRTLPAGVLQNSLIYFYRIEPKIKNLGPNAYIEKVGAEGVDEEWLKQKHGGGKYRAWLNTADKKYDVQRVVSIAGPAKIYPEHELVDGAGNPVPAAPSAAAPQSAITQGDIVNVVKAALEAVKEKGASAEDAVAAALSVMRKAQEGSIEILTSSLKSQANGGGDNATAALLRELLAEIRSQKNPGDRKLDKIVDAGLERLLNPPAPDKPKTLVEMLQELKALQDVDGLGGLIGPKEGAWWEPLVGKLADTISDVLKANAPALIDTYREKLRVDVFMAQQRRGAQPGPQQPAQPAPPTPGPSAPASPRQTLPLPPTAAAPSQPPGYPLPTPSAAPHASPPAAAPQTSAPQPGATEEEQVFALIRKQITELIATCFEEEDSGADAAITVKRAHRPLLPLLRPHFQEFEKVLAMAKVEPALASIATHPDFPEFAKEFWEEFMRD